MSLELAIPLWLEVWGLVMVLLTRCLTYAGALSEKVYTPSITRGFIPGLPASPGFIGLLSLLVSLLPSADCSELCLDGAD